MNPKILITGATGTNGREAIKQLIDAGYSVRVMVRNPGEKSRFESERIEIVKGDYSRPDTLLPALDGIESAFLVTPVHREALVWSRHFIDAAKKKGLKHIVRLSGMHAAMDSQSEIIRMHAEADHYLKASSLDYTILQPNAFYQNMFFSARSIKEQNAFYLPLRDGKQSLVDVRDIAAVAVKVLTRPEQKNKTFILTGPEPLSYYDVAEKLSSLMKREIEYINMSPETAKQQLLASGMPEWNASALIESYGAFASGMYTDTTDDINNILKRDPISFNTFLKDYKHIFGR